MRLVYLGTPQMAVSPLFRLHEAGHQIDLVITRPDARRGRGGARSPSPVKALAVELGLPVSYDVDDAIVAAREGAELGVVVAFGRIIKPHVLAELPMVNLHFSLLPRWRGAAPVERALLAGDSETGVCVMAVEEGLDTGGIYARRVVPIGPETTATELRAELVEQGSELLVATLARPIATWIDRAEPQVGEPTYAAKIEPAELAIDWRRPVEEVDRLVRLGGAWTTFRGKRLKILTAHVDNGQLVPITVQPEGKAPMSFADWRNGARPTSGERWGPP